MNTIYSLVTVNIIETMIVKLDMKTRNKTINTIYLVMPLARAIYERPYTTLAI